ncbi:MAG TPA: UDP-N-acetylmuramoyl-L-alanine--D-glutamate ligase, partial [Actinobacteria bacterium]|nr:UDP-N-acetylmuramoyl-L-alanine--D-glutamate ligase [Actinomycetota bacterium]
MTEHRVSALQRDSQWSDLSVCVVGLGVAGYSCADVLMQLGASVTIVDESPGDIHQERAEVLGSLGAAIRFGEAAELPLDSDLVVVSPGIRPSAPVLAPALAREIPIWGELELAWRLRRGPSDAPWMCVTGTNGKTTVSLMLESMLTASGARAVSAGNIGVPLVDVIMHDDVEVIAVEVGAPQLPFVASMSPYSAVCLNIADDHIDHFGSLEEYVNSKERIYRHTLHSAIYSVDDDVTRGMVERADVIAGCRAIGFTLGVPDVGMVGVVDNLLVDRAYLEQRRDAALELASINDVRPQAPH